MTDFEPVFIPGRPLPKNALTPAIRAGDIVFVSGQVGIDAATGAIAEGDIAAQTRTTLANLRSVLEAADLDLSDVAKTTVFLTRAEDIGAMDAGYREVFGSSFPARSAVVISALARPALLVEIEAIAIR
ncbi:MAG TPA: RidA family protein [Lacisediminihabitans sp.]|uniref:RidA family protein n=1 Tax=Lacisediminihabitans sp. TaxID=2787631 RepID=UPI002ED781FF